MFAKNEGLVLFFNRKTFHDHYSHDLTRCLHHRSLYYRHLHHYQMSSSLSSKFANELSKSPKYFNPFLIWLLAKAIPIVVIARQPCNMPMHLHQQTSGAQQLLLYRLALHFSEFQCLATVLSNCSTVL